MGAGIAQFLPHGDIVFQVVFRAVGVENVTRVADRAFADLVLLLYCVHGDAHVLHPVQAVEHTEYVNAGVRRHAHKFLHHVVRIVGVTHTVGPAQQHLGHHVGQGRAQVAQALPGAFLQEAIGHVKRRAAPAFDGKQLGQGVGIGRGDLDHVDRPHPCGQQRLVPVAHGGVGDQHLFLRLHPVCDGLRAFLFQKVAGAVGGGVRVGDRRAGGL